MGLHSYCAYQQHRRTYGKHQAAKNSDKNMKIILLTFIPALLAVTGPMAEGRFASINVNLAMTVSEDSHRLTEDMVRICAQETDLSMEELRKFRQNDFTNSSEATQCFTHCIYEQMGVVRDGVFIERDALGDLADVTDPNKLIHRECAGIKGANKCETAFKIHRCHQEVRLPKDPKSATVTPQSPVNINNNNNNVNQQ